jgi:DNA-binding CsgD family transcriptional regulator/PAS domain-containing protein
VLSPHEPPTTGPEPSRADRLEDALSEAVAHALTPALVLEIATERILAANALAQALLAPGGDPLPGRTLDEFFSDPPARASDLLLAGRVQGYATTVSLRRRRTGPAHLHAWVQAVGQEVPPRLALGVVVGSSARAALRLPSPAGQELTPVVGTADEGLRIDRISNDIEALLGYSAPVVIGRSILSLVDEISVAQLLEAIAQVTAGRSGIILDVAARSQSGETILLEAVLWPLIPAPRCAFALLPAPGPVGTSETAIDPALRLSGLARSIGIVNLPRYLFAGPRERDLPGLSELTTRELDIVSRLTSGDRVPAIASALFLSPSTVRNHLLSIYRKLGVHSQQELIHAFREPPGSR